MGKITSDHIKQAYELGKYVHKGEMDADEAVARLVDAGMKDTSAMMYITALDSMLSGKVFQRTISFEAAKYYIENIKNDYDEGILDKALSSLEQHVKYIGRNGGEKKIQERELIDEYRHVEDDVEEGLRDLNELGLKAAKKYKAEYKWREVELSDGLKEKIKKWLLLHNNGCSMATHTGRVVTKGGNTTDFSYQMLEICTYFVDFYNEGKKYDDYAKALLEFVKNNSSSDLAKANKFGTKLFSCLREAGADWKEIVAKEFSDDISSVLSDGLDKLIPDDKSRDYFIRCITSGKSWSHSSKTIERSNYDYVAAAVKSLAGVVALKQGFMSEILHMFSDSKEIYDRFDSEVKKSIYSDDVSAGPDEDGYNMIYYGAPGAGKSYKIDNLTDDKRSIRTVFHPEYQHSDFVGCLKPSCDAEGKISYSYVAGPFVKILLLADKDPSNDYTLIIEEINRANAPAVFGDVFQLLDRDDLGRSGYTITPDDSLRKFLEKEGYKTPDKVFIPRNLRILATMNSSDQGVFLMDSAFKRRWQFHYCPIEFDAEKPSFTAPLVSYNNAKYSWRDFVSVLNNHLKKLDIEEDRLIGPYFLSDKEREDESATSDAIAGKLLIYLWDDVLRHGLRDKVFDSELRTFAELVTTFKDGKSMFSKELQSALEAVASKPSLETEPVELEDTEDEEEAA